MSNKEEMVYIDSQISELEKLAAIRTPLVRKLFRGGSEALTKAKLNPMDWGEATKGRLVGGLIGAAPGAAIGAATAEEGERGSGALRGGLIGAGLGVGGGQLATAQGRRQVRRLGQRQAHGLTGYMPGAYKKEKGLMSAFGRDLSADERLKILREMRMTDIPEKADVQKLREAAKARDAGNIMDSQAGRALLEGNKGNSIIPGRVRDAMSNLKLRRQVAMLEQAESGSTSLPGYIRNLVRDPKKTVGTGLLAAGGMATLPSLAFSAPEVVSAAREGDLKRLGSSLAETGLYATTGNMPIVANELGGALMRGIGGIPGGVIDRIRGVRRSDV